MIQKDTQRAVERQRSETWLWVLLDKYRVGLQLLLPQACETCFVIYCQEQKKKPWYNELFSIHALSRQTALLTLAGSLGWISTATCCGIYKDYHKPVIFTLPYVYWLCAFHHLVMFEHLSISCLFYPSLHAGYIVYVRGMVLENIVLVKSFYWPCWHPRESPTYIFHEE